jgi:hypothetical protein
MYLTGYPNKKRYFKDGRNLFNDQHLSLESVKTEYSGFALVLFNKQMSNLIHCPVTAKGSYAIPDTVLSIDSEAFSQCKDLTSIVFPGNLKTIGCQAFENCSSLNSIIIPESVIGMGYRMFSNCSGLKSIYMQSLSPQDLNLSDDIFYNVDKETCKLYVPYGTKSDYERTDQLKEFKNILEIIFYLPLFGLN